jgi:PEP-CTERM motif
MSILSAALAILAVTVGGSMAYAGPLPAAVGLVSCDTKTSPGYIQSSVSCNGGTDSGLVTYAPFAGVSVSALGQGLTDDSGVTGLLEYSFEVTGGAPGAVVPVDIDTVLQALPISIGYVFAQIIVTADGSASVTICTDLCDAGSGVTGFTGTLQVDAVSGDVYTDAIYMYVEAIGALGNTSYVDGGTASIDPYIYVDPAFADASQYTIVVSPNVGNVPQPVPEPGSLAIFASALFGFWMLCRWNHRPIGRSCVT